MELLIDSNEIIKNRDRNIEIDVAANRSQRVFSNLAFDVVNRGADYVIKSMPINNNIKNILLDVKKSFETKDFKQIIKTAVGSSISEGLELLKLPKNVITDITKITDITFKGGLREGICAAIDIVTNKYLKNNIFYNIIKDFINKTKDFIFNKSFSNKIESGINNILNRADKFKDKCKEWYKYYEKLDFEKMNNLAKALNRERNKVANDIECVKENNIMQNMMKLVNNKKDKLSNMQLQICNNL